MLQEGVGGHHQVGEEEVGVQHQAGEVEEGVQYQVGEEEVGAQHHNLLVEVEAEAAEEERQLALDHQGEVEEVEEGVEGQRQEGLMVGKQNQWLSSEYWAEQLGLGRIRPQ